jgi:hypothetical protein
MLTIRPPFSSIPDDFLGNNNLYIPILTHFDVAWGIDPILLFRVATLAAR